MRAARQRVAVITGAGIAAALAWCGIRLVVRVALAAARRMLRIARWCLLVATFRLFTPCPDCHKYVHANARVCHRCGYRRGLSGLSRER
jgi:ribosomal protein L32